MNRRSFLRGVAIATACACMRGPYHAFAAEHLSVAAPPASSGELFASLSGNDHGDGSFLSPLRSLSEAARRMREASLPVTLSAFTAVADGAIAVLRWTTQAETNNAGFYVEQAAGAAWEDRLFVPGHGTTSDANDYEARIHGLPIGSHRFRLRQIDFDGHTSFSSEVEVEGAASISLTLMPNPARETVQVLGLEDGQTVALYDLAGRRVFQQRATGFQLQLNVALLARGHYQVRAGMHTQSLTLL